MNQSFLNQGRGEHGRVLKPETVETMSVNQTGPLRVQRMVAAMPPLTHDVEFFPDMDNTWGLSFMINIEEAPSGRSAGSLAWRTLASGSIWRRALAASMRPKRCLSPTSGRCRYFWRSNPKCIATCNNIMPSYRRPWEISAATGLFIAQGAQIARTLPDRRACRIIPQDQRSCANRPLPGQLSGSSPCGFSGSIQHVRRRPVLWAHRPPRLCWFHFICSLG